MFGSCKYSDLIYPQHYYYCCCQKGTSFYKCSLASQHLPWTPCNSFFFKNHLENPIWLLLSLIKTINTFQYRQGQDQISIIYPLVSYMIWPLPSVNKQFPTAFCPPVILCLLKVTNHLLAFRTTSHTGKTSTQLIPIYLLELCPKFNFSESSWKLSETSHPGQLCCTRHIS